MKLALAAAARAAASAAAFVFTTDFTVVATVAAAETAQQLQHRHLCYSREPELLAVTLFLRAKNFCRRYADTNFVNFLNKKANPRR